MQVCFFFPSLRVHHDLFDKPLAWAYFELIQTRTPVRSEKKGELITAIVASLLILTVRFKFKLLVSPPHAQYGLILGRDSTAVRKLSLLFKKRGTQEGTSLLSLVFVEGFPDGHERWSASDNVLKIDDIWGCSRQELKGMGGAKADTLDGIV